MTAFEDQFPAGRDTADAESLPRRETAASSAQRARNLEPEDLTRNQRRALVRLSDRPHFRWQTGFRMLGVMNAGARGALMRAPTAGGLIGFGLARLNKGRLLITPEGRAMARRILRHSEALPRSGSLEGPAAGPTLDEVRARTLKSATR